MADEFQLQSKAREKKNFFSRTKFYLFEYASLQISNLWLGVGFSVAVFSLFSVLSGNSRAADIVESLAWVFGIILVFAPISVILYARTSGEEEANPARLHQTIRKVIFYGMLTIVTISAVSLLVTAIYTGSRVAFGLGETKSLVATTLPSLVVLLLYAYFLGFVIKGTVTSPKLRKLNMVGVSFLCVLILTLVAGTAMVSGSEVSHDKQVVKDLEATTAAINKEYRESGNLPANIESLETLTDANIKAKFKSGSYTYERIDDAPYYDQPVELDAGLDSSSTSPSVDSVRAYVDGKYKLCATFKTSTTYGYGEIYPTDYKSSITGNFDYHQEGKDCFDLYAY